MQNYLVNSSTVQQETSGRDYRIACSGRSVYSLSKTCLSLTISMRPLTLQSVSQASASTTPTRARMGTALASMEPRMFGYVDRRSPDT